MEYGDLTAQAEKENTVSTNFELLNLWLDMNRWSFCSIEAATYASNCSPAEETTSDQHGKYSDHMRHCPNLMPS